MDRVHPVLLGPNPCKIAWGSCIQVAPDSDVSIPHQVRVEHIHEPLDCNPAPIASVEELYFQSSGEALTHISLPVSDQFDHMGLRCATWSMIAAAIWSSVRTVPKLEKYRWVVITSDCQSQVSDIIWKMEEWMGPVAVDRLSRLAEDECAGACGLARGGYLYTPFFC